MLRRRVAVAVGRACPPWLASETEDIVQNVLIQLVEMARRRETEIEFSPIYLARAAHGAAVDEIRRRYRRREVDASGLGDGDFLAAGTPDPEREMTAQEIGLAIRACLERLVRPRKLAVVLYLHGCSVPELAKRLAWPFKRASNLVYRGLGDLRHCLEGKGITS